MDVNVSIDPRYTVHTLLLGRFRRSTFRHILMAGMRGLLHCPYSTPKTCPNICQIRRRWLEILQYPTGLLDLLAQNEVEHIFIRWLAQYDRCASYHSQYDTLLKVYLSQTKKFCIALCQGFLSISSLFSRFSVNFAFFVNGS